MGTAGAKAEGLSRLPKAWTPEFGCVAATVLMAAGPELAYAIDEFLACFAGRPVIVRSSARAESLVDRGRFESRVIDMLNSATLTSALQDLRAQGEAAEVSMGAVVQAYHRPIMRGHLSNERRVTKTRNQWQVEVEHPSPADYRINSQRDLAPPTSHPITLRGAGDLSRTLGRIGNWAAREFDSRVHAEWVLEGQTLWIVQLDLEDDAPDAGVDPREFDLGIKKTSAAESGEKMSISPYLEPWSAGAFPRYRKLRYVEDFQNEVTGKFPQLYVVRGENVEAFLHSSAPAHAIRRTLGERLVCRTDLVPETQSRFEGLNLPRTDTSSPEEIAEFIRECFVAFQRDSVEANALVFIMHHFIPSVASAWAEAVPNETIVTIDALWGLPDGLQYLEHDRFEWDTKLNVLSAEHITYKDRFLYEAPDGAWTLRAVRRSLARTASVSRSDVAFIADATRSLAKRVGYRLRVMWFVGTRAGPTIATAIPWFCHKPDDLPGSMGPDDLLTAEIWDRSHLRRLPRFDVCTPDDLDRIPGVPHKLRLTPTPEHMRNNSFIESFAERARSGGHTIEMMGSGLAHAYYIMARSGAPIIVPSQRGHKRVRKLRTFGKLVRDGIPKKIREGGEEVVAESVPPEDKRRWLLAKLMEEAQEVAEATNVDDVRSELADLLEVVRGLVRNEGLGWDEVERAADEKAKRLGAFGDATVLLATAAAGQGVERRRRPAESAVRVTRDASTITVPHIVLLEDSVEFSIAGQNVRLAFTTDGLILEQLGPKSDDGQLRLPLQP